MSLISIHENVGSILGLTQWIRVLALPLSCGLGCRLGLDPELLWGWCGPGSVSPRRPLDDNLPYAAGVALKRKKKKKKKIQIA